ncbi:GT4 family glycosyltransferase PelF [bacterium]|jgi:polysaccharide biosynthesis protein PelF|nr:GT4 family glycosyltransferase PelF [bacterium]
MSDVCLVLEGTYPYVTGGVSSWVHHYIRSLSHVRFALMVILPTRGFYQDYKYDIPNNVDSITEIYIHDSDLSHQRHINNPIQAFETIKSYYTSLDEHRFEDFNKVFKDVLDPSTRKISTYDLFYSYKSWEALQEMYQSLASNESFLDFFWSIRFAHLPLMKIADAAIPTAKVYHSLSTGFAGFAAVVAHLKTKAPMIITEHGIYTNERRIELEHSLWLQSNQKDSHIVEASENTLQEIWVTLFDHLSRLAYYYSDHITTLFESNRKMQITGGANPNKTSIIHNGIDIDRFPYKEHPPRSDEEGYVVGFVGRVVAIKDIKTMIRAFALVSQEKENVTFYLFGPTDDEPDYFDEVLQLVDSLGMSTQVIFPGLVNVQEWYPLIDVIVLTSISEGQPLVIIEANCSGIPCVTTDVGGCSEQLYGTTPDDIAIGPSGLVTAISDPQDTADCILKILNDDDLRIRMGVSGRERILKYYTQSNMNYDYYKLYQDHMIYEGL